MDTKDEARTAPARLPVSEEQYRLVIENVRDHAIFTMDPAGRVTTWNPGARRTFGYEDFEIVGEDASILFTAEDQEAGEPARELAAARVVGRAEDERWHVRKDGTRFWASGVMNPLRDTGGGILGFVKVCRDLTERRALEERQAQLLTRETAARREAEKAVTIQSEFLLVVSHELRTPLAAVLLWVHLLRTGAVEDDQKSRALEVIEQNARAQQQLVDDLLDMSRMMSGELRLDLHEVDPAPVVRAAVDAVEPMAEARGVAVGASLDGAAGAVRADPRRLQQAVWNLVNNAVKFTDKGGRVTVTLERADGRVRVRVADTGKGISAEFLPHLFAMFRQADASSTRAQGGLGLGLALARKLVELHGGTIRGESEGVGRGATFTVELPLAAAT